MKKWLLIGLFGIFVFGITSCKDDDPVPANNFEIMSDYLVQESLDLPNLLTGWIVGAPAEGELNTFLSSNYVIDIRSQTDFDAGHIEGAVNTSLVNIIDAAAAADKPIVVACYTGQTAGHAVMALRLSGYDDARVLKFGMSGWNSTLSGKWETNSGDNGNTAVGHNKWKAGNPATANRFQVHNFESTETSAELMLQERVRAMLQNGFKGVSNADVLANPEGYFINNFWAAEDVEHYGMIEGAYRIFPMSLANGDFEYLNPEETIVTYCWTGQTSSMVTAYLNVLGFDALSLKFGANGMIYSDLESHKFVTPTTNLPVVATSN